VCLMRMDRMHGMYVGVDVGFADDGLGEMMSFVCELLKRLKKPLLAMRCLKEDARKKMGYRR